MSSISQLNQLQQQQQSIRTKINVIITQLQSLNKQLKQLQVKQGKYVKFTVKNNLRKELIDLDYRLKEIYCAKINCQRREQQKEKLQQQKQQHQQNHEQQQQRKGQQQLSSLQQQPQHVRFYDQNSQVALDVSRTQHHKDSQFHRSEDFSFSNYHNLDSLKSSDQKTPMNKIDHQKHQQKEDKNQGIKLNLFCKNVGGNSLRMKLQKQERIKEKEMEARLAVQKEKLQRRLEALSPRNNNNGYLKYGDVAGISRIRLPIHSYRLFEYPLQSYYHYSPIGYYYY